MICREASAAAAFAELTHQLAVEVIPYMSESRALGLWQRVTPRSHCMGHVAIEPAILRAKRFAPFARDPVSAAKFNLTWFSFFVFHL